MRSAEVELLYFAGCPGAEALLPELRRIAESAGARFEARTVETVEAARRERFLGSPTVRVDGIDVDPSAEGRSDFGLKCRIYRSETGQSPVPPLRWIEDAVERTRR